MSKSEPSAKGRDHHEFTDFHCCAEWHLAKIRSCRVVSFVYSFAFRIAKSSRRFACSSNRVGDFFGLSNKTVLRSYHELVSAGFFETVEHGLFDTNVYRVLSHAEWKEKHPDKCATKIQFPWSGEGDTLGQKLFAASGGRVRFKEFQVRNYRTIGLPEDKIVSLFESYWAGAGIFRKPKNVPFYFLKCLQTECNAERSAQREGLNKYRSACSDACIFIDFS